MHGPYAAASIMRQRLHTARYVSTPLAHRAAGHQTQLHAWWQGSMLFRVLSGCLGLYNVAGCLPAPATRMLWCSSGSAHARHLTVLLCWAHMHVLQVAGTEMGITEPEATFSACYGAAFLMQHPTHEVCIHHPASTDITHNTAVLLCWGASLAGCWH